MRALRFVISIPGLCVIGFVRAYQICISPLIGANCRFSPSCSAYMIQAIKKYGLLRGGWKGTCRICRCHPWNEGGHDPP